MKKRGQVTTFVIIGILIIVLIILLLFIRNKVYIGPIMHKNIEDEFPPIEEHIQECIIEKATPRIRQMGLQGGFIKTSDGTYRRYQGNKISYLCYNIKDQKYCRSRILTRNDMEKELAEYIKRDMETQCLDIQSFKKIGLDLTQGTLDVNVDIGQDTVIIDAKLPITISKGEQKAYRDTYTARVDLPLGRLYESARDIVSAESINGYFDTLIYSLAKTQITNKLYVIQKLQPYPDKLYIMKIKDVPSEEDPFIFQFFIQGEPR